MEVDQEHRQEEKEVELEVKKRESAVVAGVEEETIDCSTADALVVDEQLKAMAVSAEQRLATNYHHNNYHYYNDNSTATSTGTRSAGDSLDDLKARDRSKPFLKMHSKFESGSGSGDQDGIISMEDATDIAAKKRKTRRGKPKNRKLKPYSKQLTTYQQQTRINRSSGRPTKSGRLPPAPNNTTQFLMEDHNEIPDLDKQIAVAGGVVVMNESQPDQTQILKPIPHPRTRDSSFSVDSETDDFYSSPEDEEEFLTKEFSNAYEVVYAERLNGLSKEELIQEYAQLDAKIEMLAEKLCGKISTTQIGSDNNDTTAISNDYRLKILQQRIDELLQQNELLRRENELLRKQQQRRTAGSPMSSVDSESDSDSSSSHSDSSCNNRKQNSAESPVPASYNQSHRDRTNRPKSSCSSIETDSTANDCSLPISNTKSNDVQLQMANGHSANSEDW